MLEDIASPNPEGLIFVVGSSEERNLAAIALVAIAAGSAAELVAIGLAASAAGGKLAAIGLAAIVAEPAAGEQLAVVVDVVRLAGAEPVPQSGAVVESLAGAEPVPQSGAVVESLAGAGAELTQEHFEGQMGG